MHGIAHQIEIELNPPHIDDTRMVPVYGTRMDQFKARLHCPCHDTVSLVSLVVIGSVVSSNALVMTPGFNAKAFHLVDHVIH